MRATLACTYDANTHTQQRGWCPSPNMQIIKELLGLGGRELGADSRDSWDMDRLAARLSHLPHDELVAIAAQGMREGIKTRNMGEGKMALHSPLPEWAVTDVLLSPDLLVSVLSTLALRDGYTARVCKAWQLAWKDKNRGVLRPVRTIKDGDLSQPTDVVALPDGGAFVANKGGDCLQPYSAQGVPKPRLCAAVHNLQGLMLWGVSSPVAIALLSDGTAWVIEGDDSELVKVRLADGERLIGVEQPEGAVDIALVSDSLLVLGHEGGGRIAVHDAATGAFQRFIDPACGDEPLDEPCSMCVHGELLFIVDSYHNRIVVCRHADGAHVRCIGKAGETQEEREGTAPGEFNCPVGVAVGHGRLYVSELEGRRIQVLTLEGLPLQVLDSPDGEPLYGLCVDANRVWCVGWGHMLTVLTVE